MDDLLELTDRRWHTELVVSVRGESARSSSDLVRGAFRSEVERLERAASRFRPDSEVTRANQAAGRWVPASPLLGELVRVAIAAADATDGLVSPCLGRQVDAVGYRSWAGAEEPALEHSDPGGADAWQRLELGTGRIRVPAGSQLDLGATAKAWLADELAERLAEQTGLDVAANMGGDLRAVGEQPWVLGVDHDTPDPSPCALQVNDGGLATSGVGRRRWSTAAGPAHHIVDPRTGRSAVTRWWSVSALAATATGANIAATAALILDDRGPAWLEARGLAGVLTAWSGSGSPHRVLVGDWPREVGAA